MTKYLITILLFIHGSIHLMGFAKAFGFGHLTQIYKPISKSTGLLWLLVSLLCMVSALLLVLKNENWPIFVFLSILISQILILQLWSESKYGTIINIILLLFSIPSYGAIRFNQMVNKEIQTLIVNQSMRSEIIIEEKIAPLPEIVKKWLIRSNVIGKEKIEFVRLKQKGKMQTSPNGHWMDFEAKQYYNVNEPAFNWQTKLEVFPAITIVGRDKLNEGKGEMLIKLLSCINIVNKGHTKDMNEATLLRFLGELVWFPSAALNAYLTWENISDTSAKVIMRYKNNQVEGIMRFTPEGDVISFEAERFYNTAKEKWVVECLAYRSFNGIRIPSKCKVIWKLKAGDFNWLNLELTDVSYNTVEMY